MKAHADWTIASAGVRQGHPAPEERTHERPLASTAVRSAVAAAAAAAAVAAKSVAVEALLRHVD